MPRIVKCGPIQTSLACVTEESIDTIKQASLEKHLKLIEQAGREGVQILCMQELFIGPYFRAEQNPRWYLGNTTYRSGKIMLGARDGLFLYTDGVTEAMDTAGELFSGQRLEQFLAKTHGSSVRQIVGVLVDEVRKFAAGAPQSDDITAPALQYAGPAERVEQGVEINLKNRISELEKVSEHLDELGARHRLSPKILHDLNLALEEIITNVISYGYTDEREHEILVRLRVEPQEVTVEVEDDGQAFNPLEVPVPDVTRSLEERAVGGLGIHLVQKLMDSLGYKRQGNKNLLIMRKKTEEI
ncbi:MAG: ATP-binding protein [Deltaproteobacteria bacterium]|nr:ATP-binding protein [Deltaproteobacteria bacterium]